MAQAHRGSHAQAANATRSLLLPKSSPHVHRRPRDSPLSLPAILRPVTPIPHPSQLNSTLQRASGSHEAIDRRTDLYEPGGAAEHSADGPSRAHLEHGDLLPLC